MIQNGQPVAGIGGAVTIGNVVTPYISTKHTEASTILKAYGGDINRVFLGLQKIWNQWHLMPTPILNATEMSDNIIRTKDFGAELEFLLPYQLPPIRVRALPIDGSVGKVGEHGSKFPVVFSDEFSPGDVIKLRSLRSEYEIRVSTEKDDVIESFGEGDGWVHQCFVNGTSPSDYIPREYLSEGTAVWKTDNPGGEHTVHGTSISKSRNGLQQQSYKIANAERRIIHTVTSRGDLLGQNIQSRGNTNIFSGLFNYPNMTAAQQNAIVNYYNVDPKTGKEIPGTGSWVPSIIEMMAREKALLKEYYMTWGKGSVFIGKGDQQITTGDGWYQTIKKRGWYRTYHDRNKIIDVMKDMMDQLFAGNRSLLPKDRKIKFTMGMGAMIAAQQAFREIAFGKNMFIIVNDGKNPITNGMFSGDVQNLKYKDPRVISVEFPEYGVIEIEHNPALDYLDGEEEYQPHTGHWPNSSYMIWVQDVTADNFSNAIPNGAKANTISGVASPSDANVVMVLPEGYYDTTSFVIGTGCNPTLKAFAGASADNQIVSTREKGFEIIMDFAGELYIHDPSRIYIAEFVPQRIFY